MAKQQQVNSPALTRAGKAMLVRLQGMARKEAGPSIMQISTAWATMATKPQAYTDELWYMLYVQAQRARGSQDTCCRCGGSGVVYAWGNPRTCGDWENGEMVRKTCNGTGKRIIGQPQAGDMANTCRQEQAKLLLMHGAKDWQQRVTALLNTI